MVNQIIFLNLIYHFDFKKLKRNNEEDNSNHP